jgi:cell wall-associated NlpC family hydrolase
MQVKHLYVTSFVVVLGIISYGDITECHDMPFPPRFVATGITFGTLAMASGVIGPAAPLVAIGFVVAAILNKNFRAPDCQARLAAATASPMSMQYLGNAPTGSSGGNGQSSTVPGNVATGGAAQFVSIVKSHVGQAYVFGGTNINATDCSGLVYYALQQMGIAAPRTSQTQYTWTKRISVGQLSPGDLVFTEFGAQGPGPDHVGIYIGNGQVLQDPHTGAKVNILSLTSFTARQQVGYGRIPSFSSTILV